MNVAIEKSATAVTAVIAGQTAFALLPKTVTIQLGEFDQSPFEFTFKSDGTGTAWDVNCDREVSFIWDPVSLADCLPGEVDEALGELAHELFWDEINDQLDEDRVLEDGDYGSGELVFQNGSSEEFERVLRLILYSFPSLWDDSRDEIDIMILANTETEAAYLDSDYGFMEDGDVDEEIKSSVGALVSLALQRNEPYGWFLEYNDGVGGRASGYCESAETLKYTIPRPSFHEIAEARAALLVTFAGHDLAEDAGDLLPEEEG